MNPLLHGLLSSLPLLLHFLVALLFEFDLALLHIDPALIDKLLLPLFRFSYHFQPLFQESHDLFILILEVARCVLAGLLFFGRRNIVSFEQAWLLLIWLRLVLTIGNYGRGGVVRMKAWGVLLGICLVLRDRWLTVGYELLELSEACFLELELKLKVLFVDALQELVLDVLLQPLVARVEISVRCYEEYATLYRLLPHLGVLRGFSWNVVLPVVKRHHLGQDGGALNLKIVHVILEIYDGSVLLTVVDHDLEKGPQVLFLALPLLENQLDHLPTLQDVEQVLAQIVS